MSHTPESIDPFLNANYWDGHMLGDGQRTPPNPDSFSDPSFLRSGRFASRALRERLQQTSSVTPLQIYNRGDVFSPDEWEPGTIALFDRESLHGPETPTELDLSEYNDLPVPLRPTSLDPRLGSLGPKNTHLKDEALGIGYWRFIYWGVVTPTKHNRNALHYVNSSYVSRDSNKVPAGLFLPGSTPMEIGVTSHRGTDRELLSRHNILHVVMAGLGKREKQRKPFSVFLGRVIAHNV